MSDNIKLVAAFRGGLLDGKVAEVIIPKVALVLGAKLTIDKCPYRIATNSSVNMVIVNSIRDDGVCPKSLVLALVYMGDVTADV